MKVEENGELRTLLDKCRKGDQASWAKLVTRLERLVYSVPKRMGLRDDECSDIFQTTFLALYQNLDRIQNADTIPKWVSVTAAREALRLKRFKHLAASQSELNQELDQLVADEDASAEALAVQANINERLWNAVDQLQERCRELLKSLYSDEDSDYQEISKTLAIPIGAIGPTRARCLDKLRTLLRDRGFFE